MKNGCWGKILRIDLNKMQTSVQDVAEDVYRNFLGGSGLGAKIIADEVDAGVSPLSPENKVIFASGPMNAVRIPGGGRWTVSAISPLTGLWGEANGGGFFGSKLKSSGYDAIVLEGKSDRPVYISVDNGTAKIEDAADYWGMDAIDTAVALNEKIGRDFSVASIGQAGEREVPIACIISDQGHGHAGRTGMGAVMGSKKVKAVVVGGQMKVPVFDEENSNKITVTTRKLMTESAFLPDFRQFGQPGAIIPRYAAGLLPIKNWLTGDWGNNPEMIAPPVYNEVLQVKQRACAYCPMACKRWVKVDEGPYKHEGPGPEYETLAAMGSQLCINNLKAISFANDLCNRYGIDTMSGGCIIAMVFELYEKGIVTEKDLDGIKAQWGDADAMIALVRKIGLAEGIGKELGKGVASYKKTIGESAEDAALEVRGLEIPGHDPRAYFSMGVTYVTSPRGACHLHGFSEAAELGALIPEIGINETVDRFEERTKGFAAIVFQDLTAIYNSLVWCLVIPWADVNYNLLTEILNLITGWELTPQSFLQIGERITNLKQIINLSRGLKRSMMHLPKRFLSPLPNGGAAGKAPNVEIMLEDYLKLRKWDENGIPASEKLKELGLSGYKIS